MVKNLECMGDYVKTGGELVRKSRMQSILLSKGAFTFEEARKWLDQNGFAPIRMKDGEGVYEFHLKEAPTEPKLKDTKETVKLDEDVKVVCYKTIDPIRIEFDKSTWTESRAKKWLDTKGFASESVTTTSEKFVSVQQEFKGDTNSLVRKGIGKGIEYIYSERQPLQDSEEQRMKRKGLLDSPQRVAFHMPFEVAVKTAKAANDEFVIEGLASTGEIDRDGDIVDPKAFTNAIDGYMENPILCNMHNWDEPIGIVTYAKVVAPGETVSLGQKSAPAQAGGLYVKAFISKSAPKVRELISEGVLKAFSIGFMIKDAVWDDKLDVRRITELELFEISVVTIPSNRRSLFSMSKAFKTGTDLICVDCSTGAPKEGESCCEEIHEPELNEASEKIRTKFRGSKAKAAAHEPELILKTFCEEAGIDLSKKDYAVVDTMAKEVIELCSPKQLEAFAYEAKNAKKGARVDQFLSTPDHDQKLLSDDHGYFELALFAKALKEVCNSDKWSTSKILNFDYWDGKQSRPMYAYLETGRDQKEELLISGYMFVQDVEGHKVAVNIHLGYGCWYLDFYSGKDTDSSIVTGLLDSITKWTEEHNFYKNEKISYFGKFLTIPEMNFDEVKLPATIKQSIKVGALDFFDKKEAYVKNNIPFKRGMIWAGLPGTGKTMTAKVLLANCKTTFIWIVASDVDWGSASDVKRIFAMARKLAPCIVLCEDVDDFLQSRGVIDALKTEMDGLKSNDGIVTILCSNYPENIPPALSRPGRFDDVIKFELPDEALRRSMLDEFTKTLTMENRDALLNSLAAQTKDFSGAELKELVIYSILIALDANRETITEKDLLDSLDKMLKTKELISDIRTRKGLQAEIEVKSVGIYERYAKARVNKADEPAEPEAAPAEPAKPSTTPADEPESPLNQRQAYTGTTSSTEGEDTQEHTHEIEVLVTFDTLEQIIGVEGEAKKGNNDHSHPIAKMGETQVVDNHWHTFSSLVIREGAADAPSETVVPVAMASAPRVLTIKVDKKGPKSYLVPKEIMEVILTTVVDEKATNQKLLGVVLFLEDLVTMGAKEATTRYYVRQIDEAVNELQKSKVSLRDRLEKVLEELHQEGVFSSKV